MKLKLSKPISAHDNDQVTELDLREPNGEDVVKAGTPFKFEFTEAGTQLMVIDAGAVARMISRLAAIPTSSVGQMSARDFNTVQAAVLGFFGDAVPVSGSTGTSNSPASSGT